MNVAICVNNYRQRQGINSVVDQFIINKSLFSERNIEILGVYDCFGFNDDIPKRFEASFQTKKESFFSKLKKTFLYDTFFGQIATVYLRMVRPSRRVYRNIDFSNIDIILSQDLFTSYQILKHNKKARLIYMTHIYENANANLFMNYPKLRGGCFERYLNKIVAFTINNSKAVVTICENAGSIIRSKFDNGSVYTVYNSFKDSDIRNADAGSHDLIRFVTASHMTYVKGFDKLLDVLPYLCVKEECACEFHFYGDGEYYTKLKELIEEKHLNNVLLHGNVERPYTYYHDKDVYFSVSRMETLPMGIIEAMCVGLPVLSTDVGAISELVHSGENGIIVGPEIQDIIRGFELMINKKNQLHDMGKESKKIFNEKCSRDKWIDSFSDIFKNTIGCNPDERR